MHLMFHNFLYDIFVKIFKKLQQLIVTLILMFFVFVKTKINQIITLKWSRSLSKTLFTTETSFLDNRKVN